jgi:peptidoglycan/xylan/chitin deacetylase (PgdA/CDA1 family)
LELKRLINFLDEVNIACTLFVVPYGEESLSSAAEEFSSCLRVALDRGHELALHGYRHTKNEFGCFYPIPLPIPFPTLKIQKERLEKGLARVMDLIGVRPLGFRAPFYLHNNGTLKALSSLGFHYDSSATFFKPTHSMHLRIRWLRDCKPFVSEGVVEIPVSGDYTFGLKPSDFSDFLRIVMRDFEWVKSRQGVFVLNNHPQHLSDAGYRFLRTLVDRLSKRTDFLRLCDVAEMYL